jgi:valyl-tRNA synthetase
MSKSRPEKSVDPLDMIDVYGSDALRFYLITAGAPGNDIKLDVKVVDGKKQIERIEGARNFANKLWNAARFVLGKLEGSDWGLVNGDLGSHQSLPNQWIQERANQTITDVRRLMDDYQYGEAGRLIYEFAWNDFCDWYVELAKLNFNRETAEVLIHTLDTILRLLHPFMPFVTEELWQKLKEVAGAKFQVAGLNYPALCLAPYPISSLQSPISELPSPIPQMSSVQEVIRAIRNIRAEYKVPPEKKVQAMISAGAMAEVLQSQRTAIAALGRVDEDSLLVEANLPAPDKCATQVLGDVTVYLPMAGLVDLTAERKRLQDELDQLGQQITRSENLLASDFGKRAPANVIEKEKAKMADAAAKREQIAQRLTQLGG